MSLEHDEKLSDTLHDVNWFMVAEMCPHEYLISPIEISVNGLVHNCLKTVQFTLTSIRLIR